LATDALIVCVSTQYWDEAWFRKQHFMSHLSRSRPVLYVEPSFSILRRGRTQMPPGQANRYVLPRLRKRGDRLWTLTPPRGLPFWTLERVSRWQYRFWGTLLRRTAGQLGFERVRLWLYEPQYIQSVPTLKPERVIFDLVDDLGAYDAGSHARHTMRRCVDAALERADLLLTTSKLLAEMYAPRRLHVVPNGVRGDWIDRGYQSAPEEIRGLPHPRIGFTGAIFPYLDFDLLVSVARAFPSGCLVLVGAVYEPEAAARLAAEPNVLLLGPRPQEKIPDFLHAFDVCLSPFRAGDVRRAVNPLKVYEYLAAGRPVVSTPLDSLMGEPVAEEIRFAEGAEETIAHIQQALAEDDATRRSRRKDAARAYTWESLSARVEDILTRAEREWGPP